MEIRDRIKKGMEFRGMTASELAQKSGVNKSLISKYLKGTVEPKQSTIYALARALRVSPAWLLGYEDQMVEVEQLDLTTLSESNKIRIKAYYDALIESQKGDNT